MTVAFIKIPPVWITFRYVLILELLNDEDPKTGAMLHGHLSQVGLPSQLTVCKSAEDVREAIETARSRLSKDGIPAIHIETHGSEPSDDIDIETVFGNDDVTIAWRSLGPGSHD
jgi:hypothetical protein